MVVADNGFISDYPGRGVTGKCANCNLDIGFGFYKNLELIHRSLEK